MKILFLGDIVGDAGFKSVKKNLPNIVSKKGIDFVCVNGENAASEGVGLTENIANELFNVGVDVITTGNHVWDQKEIYEYIKTEKKVIKTNKYEWKFTWQRFFHIQFKKKSQSWCIKSYG